MNYILPKNVTSPRDAISNVDVLYDGGENSASIAKITWFGKSVIGMRWNVSMREWDDPNKNKPGGNICLGNPVSRGHATWFILPAEMFDSNTDLAGILKTINNN